MNRKNKFFFIAFLSITFITKAQLSKTDGPIKDCKEPFDMQSVIGVDNNAFYIYRNDELGNMFVQRYNKKTFAKEWQTDVSIKQKNLKAKNWNSKALCYLKGGKIYIFIPAADVDKKRGVLLLTTLDTDGVISDNLLKEVGEINNEFIADKHFDQDLPGFGYSFSPDSTKLVFSLSYNRIFYKHSPRYISTVDLKNLDAPRKEICDGYSVVVVHDSRHKNLAGYTIGKLSSFAINNEGKLAYAFDAQDERARDVGFIINIYDPATNTEKTYLPTFDKENDLVIESSHLQFTKDNKLLFSAITTYNITRDKKQKIETKKNTNIFISKFDILQEKVEYETLQYFTEAWKEKYKIYYYCEYDINYTPISDGGYIISAFKRGGDGNINIYSLDDAIITKITKLGKIEWIKTMPIREPVEIAKFKPTGLKTYVSYFYINEKMYYLFNDHINNETNIKLATVESSPLTEKAKHPCRIDVNTVCISVNIYGGMDRKVIQNNKDLGFYPTDKNIWLEKNKLLLYFKNKDKECFSSLSIQ